MNIHPVVFNKINIVAQSCAQQDICDVINATVQRPKVIVDAGCGTGDTTLALASALHAAKVIGFDIDPALIDAAKATSKHVWPECEAHVVEFFVEDMSRKWQDWNSKLLQVAGHVDLLWSNYSLHWVHVKLQQQAVANLIKLLKPGGIMFCNIGLFRPSLELNQRHSSVIHIPGIDEQANTWIRYFQDFSAELVITKIKMLTKPLPQLEGLTVAAASRFIKPFLGIAKTFMNSSLSDVETNTLFAEFSEVMEKEYLQQSSTGAPVVTVDALSIQATRNND